MSAGFTPGPWDVHDDGQIWSDDHPIAEKITTGPWGDEGVNFITGERSLVHHWGTVATEEAKANASLIAAAPDLYEALAAMIGKLGPDGYYPLAGEPLTARARRALAKARGEQ